MASIVRDPHFPARDTLLLAWSAKAVAADNAKSRPVNAHNYVKPSLVYSLLAFLGKNGARPHPAMQSVDFCAPRGGEAPKD